MEPAAGDAPIEVESNYQAEEIVAEEIDETPIVQAPEPVQEIIEEPVVVVEEVKSPSQNQLQSQSPKWSSPLSKKSNPWLKKKWSRRSPSHRSRSQSRSPPPPQRQVHHSAGRQECALVAVQRPFWRRQSLHHRQQKKSRTDPDQPPVRPPHQNPNSRPSRPRPNRRTI